MDEMKIESKFLSAIFSRAIKKLIAKKFGYDMQVRLNTFRTTIIDGDAHAHLDIDLEMPKDEVNKLLNELGL